MTDYQFRIAIRRFVQAHSSQKVADTVGVTKQTVDRWSQGTDAAHPVTREAILEACRYIDRGKVRTPKE